MLSRNLFRSSRSFSSFKYRFFRNNLIYYTLAFGCCGAAYSYINYKRDPESSRKQRIKSIQDAFSKPKEFNGVSRPQECEEIFEKFPKSIVVLFDQPQTGKSLLLSEIESKIYPRKSLRIDIKPDLKETVNQFKSDSELEAFEVLKWFKFITKAIQNDESKEKHYIIVDGIEKVPNQIQEYFWKYLWDLFKNNAAEVLIALNDASLAKYAYSFGEPEIQSLYPLSKDNYLKILSNIEGYDFREVSTIYEEVGPNLEYSFEMMKNKEKAHTFLEHKKQEIQGKLQNLLAKNPDLRKDLSHSISLINQSRPLGDIFAATVLAKELKDLGLAQEYLNGSVRFRNQYVLKVVQETLKKL
ncbi:unnamed protein product [Blepharisma stoltei]|uniref:ATPase domain-containing protein n=1 Tax=Blepharisma stoltei TaxID=1481888 RepID=A0AAU9J836_9CILI|nr:unnamed protein product [Blepharisma stoltei]